MPFDITVSTTFSGGGPPSGDFTQMVFANESAPTQAEVERLAQERWHTRPDWLIAGTPPKVVGVDALPSEFSYDSGTNQITVASNGGTLDGWDFAETYTQVLISSGDDVTAITNCRFAFEPTTKSQRVSDPDRDAPLRFDLNSTGRIRLVSRCLFTAHPDHGGAFGPSALMFGQSNDDTNYPTVDLMSYCSFEGYAQDAMKGVWTGKRLGIFLDCPWNIAEDATEWVDGATYNAGDVVYNSSASFWVRTCLNDGVTASPNWGSKDASNTNWRAEDPHSDGDQRSSSADILSEWIGCFMHRDQGKRRLSSRSPNRGVVNSLRLNPSGSQIRGSERVAYCILPDEVEGAFNNSEAILMPPASAMRAGATTLVEENWHQTLFTAGGGAHSTVQNNNSGWSWWSPATLSAISASYSGGALSYGYTATVGGWMRIVVTDTNSGLTADQIVDARVGDSGVLATFEVDAPANTAVSKAHTVALSGTVYAQALYQAGGGIDTLAPVQTVMVS